MMRRTLPYLGFSLACHAALLGVLLFWKLPLSRQPDERRVVLEFARPASNRPLALPASPAAAAPLPGLAVPEGGKLAVPVRPTGGRSAGVRVAVPAETMRRAGPDRPEPAPIPSGLAVPAPSAATRGLLETAPAPAAAQPVPAAKGGYTQSAALEWLGRERSLLRGPEIGFPDLLLEKGLEVDVEASFTVSAGGQVVRVEITRSSGFASVDRAVEQALRNALFEEAAGEDPGKIHIRFRLERKL